MQKHNLVFCFDVFDACPHVYALFNMHTHAPTHLNKCRPRADELPRYGGARGLADLDRPPMRPGFFDDESPFMLPRAPPPPPPRRPGAFGPPSAPYDGLGFEPYEQLFPPPPPPRQPPAAAQRGGRPAQQADEEDDPERRAFKEELEKLAADLEKVGFACTCTCARAC